MNLGGGESKADSDEPEKEKGCGGSEEPRKSDRPNAFSQNPWAPFQENWDYQEWGYPGYEQQWYPTGGFYILNKVDEDE